MPTRTCVNLWIQFGHDYKVTTDPAYDPESVNRSKLDPWYFVIPCKYGEIWPHGGKNLAVDIDYHDQIANKVRAIRGVRALQDGDREKTFLFHVDLFPLVAALVLPRKRRKLSTEQRIACAKRLKPHQYRA